MNLSSLIAKHFHEIHFGGNWTWSNLQDHLKDVTWEQATTKVHSFNTIATLTYHLNYYIEVVTKVLQGQPLVGKDEQSFDHPPIRSQEDWDVMKSKILTEAETLAKLIEQVPENKWGETFIAEKYGNYYRNIHGMIEHAHYHLGQIVLIKKLIMHPGKD
jgi:hypothetical protein